MGKKQYTQAINDLYENEQVPSNTIEAIENYVQELLNEKMLAIRHASKQYNQGFREGQQTAKG